MTENITIKDIDYKPKVLVTHPYVPQKAIDILSEKCEVIVVQKLPPNRPQILEKCKGVDALFWRSRLSLNKEVLDAAGPQLRSISTMSAGFDYVDIAELKKRNIPLGNTAGVHSKTVAELAIGLMIAAARRFQEGRRCIENSTWDNTSLRWLLGQEIRGAKVGFFGFGCIAQAIADRLASFNIGSIIYNSRSKNDKADSYNAEFVSFEKLLEESDILFIASPLNDSTREKFNKDAFDKMKSNAVLVNIARGQIVDHKALYDALKSNKIFAAGLDAMHPEPLQPDDPLMSLPNCVIIPHLGASTKINRENMAIVAAQNILRGLAGEPMLAPVYYL